MDIKGCGVLTIDGSDVFLRDYDGREYFHDGAIWKGYLEHWNGRYLFGRLLYENDYITGKPIVLLWPERERDSLQYVELYYTERLVKYRMSIMGHVAININGTVFNFSHLLNECEMMTEEEFFYRPALGRFSPSPEGTYDVSDPSRPYLDKFGRRFMRRIHVARVTGKETATLRHFLRKKLEEIHYTVPDPVRPEYYSAFGTFSNNCATIIRDALRHWGFGHIKGVLPIDLFINAVWYILKESERGEINLRVFVNDQLAVSEAPPSRISPVINLSNIIKRSVLRSRGVIV